MKIQSVLLPQYLLVQRGHNSGVDLCSGLGGSGLWVKSDHWTKTLYVYFLTSSILYIKYGLFFGGGGVE